MLLGLPSRPGDSLIHGKEAPPMTDTPDFNEPWPTFPDRPEQTLGTPQSPMAGFEQRVRDGLSEGERDYEAIQRSTDPKFGKRGGS